MEITRIPGIGPATLKKLEKLAVTSVKTLVYHLPSRYIDRTKYFPIAQVKSLEHQNYYSKGIIGKITRIRTKSNQLMCSTSISDAGTKISVIWFNNPYIITQYKEGNEVMFSGLVSSGKLVNPKIKKMTSPEDKIKFASIESIYPETKGLRSYQLNRFIKYALKVYASHPEEILPDKIIRAENLLQIPYALELLHSPPADTSLFAKAKETIAFKEIYEILLQIQKRKKIQQKFQSHIIQIDKTKHLNLSKSLTFQMTPSQKQAIKEIYSDLSSPGQMHRLLNGDVGSGKTIVAAFAILQTLLSGYQSVFLVPTSVLAHQHYEYLQNLFPSFKNQIHLITSNTRKDFEKIIQAEGISPNGIFIGTHALFNQLDKFHNLALLIIDEQHKFGVKQREILANILSQDTAKVPHVLSMSATPIPRSLALTLFGDIDVSFLEKPTERKKVITKLILDEELKTKMYEWIRNEISQYQAQAYVICPLIEESKLSDTRSVNKEFEELKKLYPEFKVELLHGKIKEKEKNTILEHFIKGETHILISTSVIEVGINNPNATIMIIEGAERFGLAQLHQFRGRVGRSDKQSYCFLKTTGDILSERLKYFCDHFNGFEVAEFDLQTRGPGEVYGDAQSGLPNLKVANILDLKLIERVKRVIL